MDKLKKYLCQKYNLTNYQSAQVIFVIQTLLSELSKIVIMSFIFHKYLLLFYFALFVMLFLRTTTGGLHFYTYLGCLLTSVIYMGLSILLLPLLNIPVPIMLLMLLLAILICYIIGPITSKYRPVTPPATIKKQRHICITFIFFYSIALYIIPENPYIISGFWVIILHSLQLIAGKIKKKGDTKE